MKRQYMIVAAALAAVVVALFVGSVGRTAERQQEKEQPMLDGLVRVDAGPLLSKIDKVEAELVLLRTVAQKLSERIESMQKSLEKMEEAMASLEKPDKWQYHLLYSTSNTAINRLGEQGWELVTAGSNFLIFRRPAAEQPQE